MQTLVIIAVIVAVPGALALYWYLRPKLVHRRRERFRKLPVPDGLEATLQENVALYSLLPMELRDELHRHVNVFLREKRFAGCGGQEITPEIRFTVAGLACLLLLNREASYFPGFTSILIYPDTYETTQVSHDGYVEVHENSRRAGESWQRGPVVLSWGDVVRGAANAGDGYNVVLHEFAHKLDEENGGTDGMPALHELEQYQDWSKILGEEFESLEHRVLDHSNDVLDAYGLTSPAEFFAVATESFFEKPVAMKKRLPDLYRQLQKYYAVDPAAWRR